METDELITTTVTIFEGQRTYLDEQGNRSHKNRRAIDTMKYIEDNMSAFWRALEDVQANVAQGTQLPTDAEYARDLADTHNLNDGERAHLEAIIVDWVYK